MACLDQDLRLISTSRSHIWNSEYICPYRNMEFGIFLLKSKKMKNEKARNKSQVFFYKRYHDGFYGSSFENRGAAFGTRKTISP